MGLGAAVRDEAEPEAPHVVEGHVEGPVSAGTVIVPEGATVVGDVRGATYVEVSGTVVGSVRSLAVRVARGGRVQGEVHATKLRVEGELDGLAHALSIGLARGSSLAGVILADKVAAEAEAGWSAVVVSGPGRYVDRLALADARRVLAGGDIPFDPLSPGSTPAAAHEPPAHERHASPDLPPEVPAGAPDAYASDRGLDAEARLPAPDPHGPALGDDAEEAWLAGHADVDVDQSVEPVRESAWGEGGAEGQPPPGSPFRRRRLGAWASSADAHGTTHVAEATPAEAPVEAATPSAQPAVGPVVPAPDPRPHGGVHVGADGAHGDAGAVLDDFDDPFSPDADDARVVALARAMEVVGSTPAPSAGGEVVKVPKAGAAHKGRVRIGAADPAPVADGAGPRDEPAPVPDPPMPPPAAPVVAPDRPVGTPSGRAPVPAAPGDGLGATAWDHVPMPFLVKSK